MSKTDLSKVIQAETGSTVKDAKAAVDALFTVMAKTIKKEGELAIAGFGTFRVAKRGARTGRNPQTGETIKIKASKSVRFKPAKAFKESL